jgi:hypothetical protein
MTCTYPYVKIWHLHFKTVGKMIIVQKERKNPREERSSGGISGAVEKQRKRDKRGQWRNRGRGISRGNEETLMG